MSTRATLVLLGMAAGACGTPPTQRAVVLPVSAEALSLLGDTLWSLPVPASEGPALVAQLGRARQRLAAAPFDANAALGLARRTADMGRLREAVGVYTKAAELHPTDPRVARYRGEVLLQLRELDLALRDFQRAAQQLMGKPSETEFVEMDGGTLLGSTLQFNTLYLMGLTYYLKGDWDRAHTTLAEATKSASTGDDAIAAGLWLFLTTRRMGALGPARVLLQSLVDSAAVSTREAELALLKTFRGDIRFDALGVSLQEPVLAPDDALYRYALGYTLLMLHRTEEAELVFDRVRGYRDWSSLPVLAAEAELARLRPGARKEAR